MPIRDDQIRRGQSRPIGYETLQLASLPNFAKIGHMSWLPTLNLILGAGGLALLFATILLYIDLFACRGRYFADRIKEGKWIIVAAVTIGSTIMTLVYSEYFKFVPCSMCWLQRIALYPQALMSLMAWRGNDISRFPLYGIGLSIFGLLVGIYQYVYQMVPPEVREGGFAPCLVDGSNADCAVKVMNVFGFVTFPLISAISFAFLIAIYLYMLREDIRK